MTLDQVPKNIPHKQELHIGYLPKQDDIASPVMVQQAKQPKRMVNANVERQNPWQKLDHLQCLEGHILDICATLEDLLQSGKLPSIFTPTIIL